MIILRFLADMNLSPLTVQALQVEGLDIIRVSDVLPAATSDTAILAFARQTGRVIITQDLDFSTLIAIGGHTQPSLITLRLSSTAPAVVTGHGPLLARSLALSGVIFIPGLARHCCAL
jgi:predicted nuclease of predicted toxin-antitoxin system